MSKWHLTQGRYSPPLRHPVVRYRLCWVPHSRDQRTVSSFPDVAVIRPLCWETKMYCESQLGRSNDHSELHQVPHSSLVVQSRYSIRAWLRTLGLVCNGSVWMPSHRPRQVLSIYHLRRTNHILPTKLDTMRMGLQRGQDWCLVSFHVYSLLHIDVWHSIHSPCTPERPLGIG